MIEIYRLTKLENIHQAQWNNLLAESEINVVFLTYQWIQSWWKCFATNRELFILFAYKENQMIGIAPLMLSYHGWGLFRYGVIEFIGTGNADYCDFIISPENKGDVLQAMFDFLRYQSPSWDMISLNNIPEHSSTGSHLRKLKESTSFRVNDYVASLCPTLLIKDEPSFALECLRKKSLKRHFNYFKKAGNLEYRVARNKEEILSEMKSFFQQHMDRRSIVGDRSKFYDSKERQFYQHLVDSLFPEGWLHFSMVRFNNVPIAYHFGFDYCGRFIWYKPAFNIDYIRKSPGEVLIKYLLEDCIQRRSLEFDFTIGDESFKSRFANKIRKNILVEIYSNRILLFFLISIRYCKRFVKLVISFLLLGKSYIKKKVLTIQDN